MPSFNVNFAFLFFSSSSHNQIVKRETNRKRLLRLKQIGGKVVWATSVSMVVIIFPILIVAQRDHLLLQQTKQARGRGGPGAMPHY